MVRNDKARLLRWPLALSILGRLNAQVSEVPQMRMDLSWQLATELETAALRHTFEITSEPLEHAKIPKGLSCWAEAHIAATVYKT